MLPEKIRCELLASMFRLCAPANGDRTPRSPALAAAQVWPSSVLVKTPRPLVPA